MNKRRGGSIPVTLKEKEYDGKPMTLKITFWFRKALDSPSQDIPIPLRHWALSAQSVKAS